MPMPNKHTTDNNYRYAFQGQEKDGETGMEAFELRLWDGRLGRWLTVDPYHEFYSPYVGMGNNPINAIDPDGGDIIVLNSSMAVGGLGHIAVLIGNDKDGWKYYSKNGTESHGLFGKSYKPNDGRGKYFNSNRNGNDFTGTGLTAKDVMLIVNERYMNDHPDGETYDNYYTISTNWYQDMLAERAAEKQVNSFYSVAPLINNGYDLDAGSCVDVAQDALRATRKDFKNPQFGNILPNDWFINFGWYNNHRSYNLVPKPTIGTFELGTPTFTPIKED